MLLQVGLKEEPLRALVHIYLIHKASGKKETLIKRPYEFDFNEYPGFGAKGVRQERVKKALRSDGSLVVGCDIDLLS